MFQSLNFLFRYEVTWKEWVGVHQKDVYFLVILFYWLFPVINLRIAKNTWDNGWLLHRALISSAAQSLWDNALATLALLYCLEREFYPCVLLQKSSVVFQCMHINSSCCYAEILSQQFPLMKPSPRTVTFISTDRRRRARNAISPKMLSANHRTVRHERPSALSLPNQLWARAASSAAPCLHSPSEKWAHFHLPALLKAFWRWIYWQVGVALIFCWMSECRVFVLSVF